MVSAVPEKDFKQYITETMAKQQNRKKT